MSFPDPGVFQPVERITVGTVGPVGERVFYLQAMTAAGLVTLKLEKQQVVAMVEHLSKVLADLPPVEDPPTLDLLEPVDQLWVVGAMAVTPYDDDIDAVNLFVEEAKAEGEEGDSIGFRVTRSQLAGLVARGAELVASGRPPCPLCGAPIDPAGHACPRSNGHAAR